MFEAHLSSTHKDLLLGLKPPYSVAKKKGCSSAGPG